MLNDMRLHRKNDIPPLTGLRFFAAFFVFLCHGLIQVMPMQGWYGPGWYIFVYTLAAEGMTLFFVLSGFVIHYNYSASIQNNPGKGIYNFFIARFARLYPLFFVGLCFDLAHNYGYSTLPKLFWQAIPYYLTLTQSWFYLILGKNALIYQFGNLPSVSWSVSTECFFYLVYPLICFGLLKVYRLRAIAIAFFALGVVGFSAIAFIWLNESSINHFAVNIFGPIANEHPNFQDSFFRWLIYFSPYTRIGEFLLGCLTATIYMRLSDKLPSVKEERLGLLLVIFSLISVGLVHYLGFTRMIMANSLVLNWFEKITYFFGLAPFAAIIIFCSVRYQNAFSRFLVKPAFLLGGEVSYSLYLFHTEVLQAFSRDAAAISSSTHLKVYLANFSRLTIAFVAIFGLAIIFYRVVEVPARRFLRKMLMLDEQNQIVALPLNGESVPLN